MGQITIEECFRHLDSCGRTGGDKGPHSLCLREIHLCVFVCPPGKFALLSESREMGCVDDIQKVVDHQGIAVATDFGNIFTGIGLRSRMEDHHCLIDDRAGMTVQTGKEMLMGGPRS